MKMPYRVVVMGSKLRKKFIIPHRELPILNQIILLGQCNALLLREWRWSRGPDRSNRRMSWDCGEGGRNDCHCYTDSRKSLEMDGTLDFDCYSLGGHIIWIWYRWYKKSTEMVLGFFLYLPLVKNEMGGGSVYTLRGPLLTADWEDIQKLWPRSISRARSQ